MLPFKKLCTFFTFQIRKRKPMFRPEISAPVKKTRRKRTNIGCGSDRFKMVTLLHSHPNYIALKKKILKTITYDSSSTLVVWCPQHVVSNDYVISILNQYGEIDNLIDNFCRRQHNSDLRIWYGTIVEYSSAEDAYSAYNGLPLQCR